MSKKAILGLPLKELIGLILAAMVLIFLWYVTADLRKVFFGDPSLTPVKASFESFSNTITRMTNNDEVADAAIMPYHIAPADIRWKADPIYGILPFNKEEKFNGIKAPEDCKGKVCVCSCEADIAAKSTKVGIVGGISNGKKVAENICTKDEKKRFCKIFSSEYKIHFSVPYGWIGPWFFGDLEKHIVNFHMIKYDKDIYVYAGIPFEEAITSFDEGYSIEYQISTDALKFYNDNEYEKAIFFFNQIIKEYKQKTAIFVISKYYMAVSYNALKNYSLAKEYYEDFETESQTIKVYGKGGPWMEDKVEELRKLYLNNKFTKDSITTNTCYLSNKAAAEKFEKKLYDEAIIDFNWVINNCKDRNYTYEVCVAKFYLGKIYKEQGDKEKAKDYLNDVVSGRCTILEEIYGIMFIGELLKFETDYINPANTMLEELNS